MAQPILSERLLNSWDSSAVTHRSLTIFYLAALGFVGIIVEGTTHEQLLNPEISIAIPVIGSSIPVLSFYIAAPIFLLFLHTQLLLQVLQLSNSFSNFAKRSPFKVAIGNSKKKEDWRNLVLPTLLTSVLLQPPNLNRYAYFLMHGIAFISYWCLVPFLLLRLQWNFLPYHSELITGLHQVCVSISFLLIAFFFFEIKNINQKERSFFNYSMATLRVCFFLVTFTLIPLFCWTVLTIPETPEENEACLPIPFNILSKSSIIKPSSNKKCSKIEDFVARNLNLSGKQLTLKPAPEILAKFHEKKNRKKLLKFYVTLNLTKRNLRFANFEGADLTKADFSGAILDYVNFRRTNLQNTRWEPYDYFRKGRDNQRVQFSVNTQNWEKSDIRDLLPDKTSAKFINLQKANLQEAKMMTADLQGADLSNANLEGANMAIVNLQGSNIYSANLKGVILNSANLKGAFIFATNLENADMRSTYQPGAFIYDTNLKNTQLSRANLQGTEISHAKLKGAIMEEVNLKGAYIYSSELQGADMQNADLQGTYLRLTNLQGANMDAANLQGTEINESNLNFTNFTKSSLEKIKFTANELLEWSKELPETNPGFIEFNSKNKFLIRMRGQNYKETTLPEMKDKNINICHSGQKYFLDAGIKPLPIKKCETEREKILEELKEEKKKE